MTTVLKTFVFSLLFSLPLLVSAEPVTYTLLEPIPGFLPTTSAAPIEVYLVGLFRLIIGVAGVLAVIRITWCGFNLMISTNPSAREEAKKCIKMAIFGLLLALGSFLIINSIRVGAEGGVGLQSPFTLPTIPGNVSGVPSAPEGTPVCVVTSSNSTLYEGQSTNISASCTRQATSFVWTASNGAPAVTGIGGIVFFPDAGVYTYTVSGINAFGAGVVSQETTITVQSPTTASCSEDTPIELDGLITCAQTNTTLDWSAVGVGEREASVVLRNSESLSVFFESGAAGSYGSFTTRAITTASTVTVGTGTISTEEVVNLPTNLNPYKYANISKASCDFRYDNLSRGICAVSGTDITLDFQVGAGTPPSGEDGGRPGCILEPNTAYYINVRNENAIAGFGKRTIDSCPVLGICEFTARLVQSLGSQFTPVNVTSCIPTPEIEPSGPTVKILTPADGTDFGSGVFFVGYSASDVEQLSQLSVSAENIDTGIPIFSRTLCGVEASPEVLGDVTDPNTGVVTLQVIAPAIPKCGALQVGTTQVSIPTEQGTYRIEVRACNIAGLCTQENRIITITPTCVDHTLLDGNGNPLGTLRCFSVPDNPPASLDTNLCAPSYGGRHFIPMNDIHSHRFRLPSNTSAHLVVANWPSREDTCNVFSRFFPGFPFSPEYEAGKDPWNVYNDRAWCLSDGDEDNRWPFLAETYTYNNGMCTIPRNNINQGDRSLLISLSTSPGDLSSTRNMQNIFGGNVLGDCGASDVANATEMFAGRFDITVTTSGTPGPGVCVIKPDVDYYLNIATLYDFAPIRLQWSRDYYGFVFGILPP